MEVSYDDFLYDAVKWFTGKETYISAKQLLVELQETKYGIHDYTTSTDPLGSVLMRDNAKYLDHYLYDVYLESYLLRDVYKHTGISFDALLARPRYQIEKIMKALEVFKKREATATGDILKNLNSQGKT